MITHILRVCRHFWTASCLHVAKISLTMILFAAIAPLELAQAQCSQFDKICNVLATDGTSANSVRVDWNQWGGANGLDVY